MRAYKTTGALLSNDGAHRIRLWRYWDAELPPMNFIMLNPSTADSSIDDPTIRKCVGFAERNGAGGIEVTNLYSIRATDPDDLIRFKAQGIPLNCPTNDNVTLSVAKATKEKFGKVVLAWGSKVPKGDDRPWFLLEALAREGIEPYNLGTNKDGSFSHPLMLSYDREIEPIDMSDWHDGLSFPNPKGVFKNE